MAEQAQTTQFRIGDWLVSPQLDQIERAGETVKLEPRTMRLLLRLSATPGEVVSGQQLLDEVWAGVVVSSQSVYQAISQLRKLLGDVDEAPTYIATVPRKGYRLVAPVEKVERTARAAEAPVRPPLTHGAGGTGEEVRALRADPAHTRAWTIAAGAVLLVLLSYLWIRNSGRPELRQTSVVVLPFVDLTAGQSDAAFIDGLTEEVSASLAQLPSLRVIARTSAYAVRDQKLDVQEIGQKLSATHIIEGTVRRSGDTVRVTAQLVDARRGHRAWSEIYNLPATDLLRLQGNIAKAVAQTLDIRFSEQDSRRLLAQRSASAEAYELYLLGRHYYRQRTVEANARAIELNRRAIALDSNFALAYVGLAQARLNESILLGASLEPSAPEIERLLLSALTLDAGLSEAHATRGMLYLETVRWSLARRDLTEAVRLDGSNVAAHSALGALHEYEGKPLLALRMFDEAAELDPLDFFRHVRRCFTLADAARYADAEEACAEARRLGSESDWPYLASSLLARSQGDLKQSLAWNERALAAAPTNMNLLQQRLVDLETLGLVSEARATLARARSLSPDDSWIALSEAYLALLSGKPEDARAKVDQMHLDETESASRLMDAAQVVLLAGAPAEAERLVLAAPQSGDYPKAQLLDNANLSWGHSPEVTLASAEKALGREQAASQRMKRLLFRVEQLERNGMDTWGLLQLRAEALAIIGDEAGAVRTLEQAVARGWRRTMYVRRAPHFAALLDDPGLLRVLNQADELIARDTANTAVR